MSGMARNTVALERFIKFPTCVKKCSVANITRFWATRSAVTPVSRYVLSIGIRLGGTPVAVLIPGAAVVDFSIEGEGKDARFVLYVPSNGSACFRI